MWKRRWTTCHLMAKQRETDAQVTHRERCSGGDCSSPKSHVLVSARPMIGFTRNVSGMKVGRHHKSDSGVIATGTTRPRGAVQGPHATETETEPTRTFLRVNIDLVVFHHSFPPSSFEHLPYVAYTKIPAWH